jgi:hypothetical protein
MNSQVVSDAGTDEDILTFDVPDIFVVEVAALLEARIAHVRY